MWWKQWDKSPMSTSQKKFGKRIGAFLEDSPLLYVDPGCLAFPLRTGVGEERLYSIYFVKGNFSLPVSFFFPSNPST